MRLSTAFPLCTLLSTAAVSALDSNDLSAYACLVSLLTSTTVFWYVGLKALQKNCFIEHADTFDISTMDEKDFCVTKLYELDTWYRDDIEPCAVGACPEQLDKEVAEDAKCRLKKFCQRPWCLLMGLCSKRTYNC